MKLHYHPASTTSRIVELFVRDQGIGLEYQLVDLFSGAHQQPDFDEINPNRLVPVLEDGNFFSQNPLQSPNILPIKPDLKPIPKTCRIVPASTR